MGQKCAEELTIPELLDAIEAGISSLQPRSARELQPKSNSNALVELRAELETAGLTEHEFVRAASITRHDLDAWISGARPAPDWVRVAIRLIALLTPSARRKLLNGQSAGESRQANRHPFSRIEDL
jgi:hypothetical protein